VQKRSSSSNNNNNNNKNSSSSSIKDIDQYRSIHLYLDAHDVRTMCAHVSLWRTHHMYDGAAFAAPHTVQTKRNSPQLVPAAAKVFAHAVSTVSPVAGTDRRATDMLAWSS
jgi:hypothetical protein